MTSSLPPSRPEAPPSKTRRKKAMLALQDLGERLTALSREERAAQIRALAGKDVRQACVTNRHPHQPSNLISVSIMSVAAGAKN